MAILLLMEVILLLIKWQIKMNANQEKYKEILRMINYFENDIISLRDDIFHLEKRAKEICSELSDDERKEVEKFARRWATQNEYVL